MLPLPPIPCRRLHVALLRLLGPTDASLECIIALLTEVRHWCRLHDENYDAISHIAHDVYLDELGATSRRRP